jgi:hypothetical protein
VTVSNLNAHLAGALHVPTDVVLTDNVLWYWPHGRTQSPWYRSVRLRRPAPGASVRDEIAGLGELLTRTLAADAA